MPYFPRYGPTNLCDGAKMAIFYVLHFLASLARHISDLHSKFAQGHTMCGSMVDIQSAAAEIKRGIKKKEDRRQIERNHRAKI